MDSFQAQFLEQTREFLAVRLTTPNTEPPCHHITNFIMLIKTDSILVSCTFKAIEHCFIHHLQWFLSQKIPTQLPSHKISLRSWLSLQSNLKRSISSRQQHVGRNCYFWHKRKFTICVFFLNASYCHCSLDDRKMTRPRIWTAVSPNTVDEWVTAPI